MAGEKLRTSSVAESLLAALCYFDIFGYPLTAEELRRFRQLPAGAGEQREPSLSDILAALGKLTERGLVESLGGLWFLPGRAGTVTERQRRFRMAESKYRRARLVTGLI